MKPFFQITLSILAILFVSCQEAPKSESPENLSSAANEPGEWTLDKRTLPPPSGASTVVYKSLEATPQPDPVRSRNAEIPKEAAAWKAFQNSRDSAAAQNTLKLIEALQVTVEEKEISGVLTRMVTPQVIDDAFGNAILIHLHGGAYTMNAGLASISEAILIANRVQIPVISVDYRMPPDHPFPAAQDDAVAVYQKVLENFPNHHLFLGGTSAGGGLTLSTALRLKNENIQLPEALFAGTPWADLTKTGDSYYIMEGIDRVLVTYEGLLEQSALLYANGKDLKDPYLSPVYGDVSGFPPTFLLTGTRDMFQSNTSRMQRLLNDSGVATELVLLEGYSHADYAVMANAPESIAAFMDLKRFLKEVLGKE
jgi:acetyl esterase/lipase